MLNTLKTNIREDDYPFFTDAELKKILTDCDFDISDATYRALVIKAESDRVKFTDVDLESSRKYWLSLAALYRKNRTGTVKRSDAL